MKAVLKIAINNIVKKKMQNVLVLLILITAAALLCTSLNFLLSANSPFEQTHRKLNGFDNLITVDPKKEDVQKIVQLYRENKQVKFVEVRNSYSSEQYAKVNGRQIKEIYKIEEREDKSRGIDKLVILKGEDKKSPASGEVWISKDVADNNGIKLNDNVEFNIDGKTIKKKVSALVVDPGLGNSIIGICRFWVGEGEIERFIPQDQRIKDISVVFKNCGDGNDVNLSIENSIGRPIIGSRVTLSTVKYANTVTYMVMGIFLLIISGFIVIFTLAIVITTITNSIYNDYKNIGIESSIGFTNFQVIMNYVLQFLILSITATSLGVIGGSIFSYKYLKTFYNNFGFADVSIPVFGTSIITVISIVIFIVLFSIIASLSIYKISPVKAIREGDTFQKNEGSAISLMKMKKINLFLSVSIKNIFGDFRKSLIMFLMIGGAVYTIIFCINVREALGDIGNNAQYWGLEKSDISLILKCNKEYNEILEDENKIRKDSKVIQVANFYTYGYVTHSKTNTLPSQSILAMAYDCDFNKIGLQNISGRNPSANDEVSISDIISKKYKKGVGDYFELYVNGNKKNYLITGVFQSIIHAGESLRIKYGSIKFDDMSFKESLPIQITVNVKGEKDIKDELKNLKSNFSKEYEINRGNQYMNNISKSDLKPIQSVMLVVILAFIAVAAFFIFNLNLINIYTNRKEIGIYKALGFTNGEIIKVYMYKIMLIILASMLVFIPIENISQSSLLSLFLGSMGIKTVSIPMCYFEVLSSLFVFSSLLIAVVIISCKIIANINGRELISE